MFTQETSEYQLFKKIECNRRLNEGNIKKLVKSISESNLLPERPILVDSNMGVIDGNHRLEAARRLGIPIFYQVKENSEIKDIILLNNNMKGWGIPDYLNYYSKNGCEHYVSLNSFIEKHKLDVNVALHMLSFDRSPGFYKDFREGKYQFPDAEAYLQVVQKKEKIDETVEYIKKKTTGNKVYLDRVTFYSALIMFFDKENFSYETFFKKLQYKLDLIRPCGKREEYVKVFLEIYNYKNHAPLEN